MRCFSMHPLIADIPLIISFRQWFGMVGQWFALGVDSGTMKRYNEFNHLQLFEQLQ